MQKLKVFIIIILLCLCSLVFSRERYKTEGGLVYYIYQDANEFYEYWKMAAKAFNYVEIGFLDTESSGSGFLSCNRDNELFFYYQFDGKHLVAIFTDSIDYLWDGFKRFSISSTYINALDYWNALIVNM